MGENNRPLDLCILASDGSLTFTKIRPDPLEEAALYLEQGWMTQNNGTELAVMDLLHDRKIVVSKFEVGQRLRPRWSAGGNLVFEKEGRTITVLKEELLVKLHSSAEGAAMTARKEFIPITW